jgi:hypothetical protein
VPAVRRRDRRTTRRARAPLRVSASQPSVSPNPDCDTYSAHDVRGDAGHRGHRDQPAVEHRPHPRSRPQPGARGSWGWVGLGDDACGSGGHGHYLRGPIDLRRIWMTSATTSHAARAGASR